MVPERFDDCLAFAKKLKQEVRCSIALQPLFEASAMVELPRSIRTHPNKNK